MMMTGGCLCGNLRYEVEGDHAAVVGKCYCLDGQRETGSGHLTFVSVPADTIRVAGAYRDLARPGDSGADVIRRFCPECGTTIVGYSGILDRTGAIRAGTLDDPSAVVATFAEFGRSTRSWDMPPSDIMIFKGAADQSGHINGVGGMTHA